MLNIKYKIFQSEREETFVVFRAKERVNFILAAILHAPLFYRKTLRKHIQTNFLSSINKQNNS